MFGALVNWGNSWWKKDQGFSTVGKETHSYTQTLLIQLAGDIGSTNRYRAFLEQPFSPRAGNNLLRPHRQSSAEKDMSPESIFSTRGQGGKGTKLQWDWRKAEWRNHWEKRRVAREDRSVGRTQGYVAVYVFLLGGKVDSRCSRAI